MRTLNKLALLLSLTAVTGCAQFTQRSTGVVDGNLTACPQWPRCVSSQADVAEKRVEPIILKEGREDVWPAVIDTVQNMPRTVIRQSSQHYLHAEVTSPWGVYVDDLELLRDGQRIDVRSSARVGYYDFNVNRERVEALRAKLRERGLVN